MQGTFAGSDADKGRGNRKQGKKHSGKRAAPRGGDHRGVDWWELDEASCTEAERGNKVGLLEQLLGRHAGAAL